MELFLSYPFWKIINLAIKKFLYLKGKGMIKEIYNHVRGERTIDIMAYS
jgi:hypothetical protein